MRILLIVIAVLAGPAISRAAENPGIEIRSRLAFTVPVKYIQHFIKVPRPDSAIFLLRRAVYNPSNPDTTSLKDMLSSKIQKLDGRSTLEDFREIILFLVELNNYQCFRVFYYNTAGKVYKYNDYLPDGTLKREVLLIDPLAGLLEITSYYKNDIVLTRSQQQYGKPVLERSIDSLWYGLTPQLKRSGNQTVYYPDGTLRSQRVYADGKLVRVAKDTVIKKDLFGNTLNYGRRKALLIAIENYDPPPAESRLPEIKPGLVMKQYSISGCINDINGIASVFTARQQFRPEHITRVMEQEATKRGLLLAFEKFTRSLKEGDYVFIHYSGRNDNIKRNGGSRPEYALVCRDWYKGGYDGNNTGFLYQSELDSIFTVIKKQVGRTGQLIFSLDASSGGGTTAADEKEGADKDPASFRGETNNLLLNLRVNNEAPFTFMASAAPDELGQEMLDEEKRSFGAYSLAMIRVLQEETPLTIADLHAGIVEKLRKNNKRQTPYYYSNFNQLLFESTLFTAPPVETKLPDLRLSGNGFVLSAGISHYAASSEMNLRFSNCASDAATYAAFFRSQFDRVGTGKTCKSYLLTDSSATKEGILKAINETISNSRPEDYFIFNFSGYCRPLSDSNGRKVTYFVPYGLKNIADTAEVKAKGIPLSQLKDLLQLVPANNQLFITEAGSTSDFQKEFIQALMEASPTIAALSNKNRVFIVPRSTGLDRFYCNNIPVEHGPLNYYITGLSDELNLFGLFQDRVYADAVKYSINKKEVDCDYFKSGYFDIFFEKEYIRDLQYFLPEELMKSRGTIVTSEARATLAAGNSKRYALVMGTNRYEGKPDWEDIYNASLDAEAVARELTEGFGYDVKLLIDKPIDSFYQHISYLSERLKVNDQLIIYVAGHGDFDSVLLDDGFIVCRNSRTVKEDPYRNTYIQYSKLEKMINKLPANQVLMMLDVCFGGTFDERVAQNKGRTKFTEYDDIADKAFFAKKLEIKTRLYLTSGGKRTVPDGYRGKHSPFALKLLEALRARGGLSKMITARDLHKFVQKLPSGPLLGSFGDDGLDSEFILLGNQ